MNKRVILVFMSFFVLYILLRTVFYRAISFGFDQPNFSFIVTEMMKRGNFIDAMNYVHVNPFGQRSWYTFFLYFYVPFFLLTKNPVTISLLVGLYNFLGIIFTYLLGKNLFGRKVALLASLFLIIDPWHVFFSSMIYTVSELIPWVVLGFFVAVIIYRGNKWGWLILPVVISILIQSFVVGGATTGLGVIILVFLYGKRSFDVKKFLMGVVLAFILWIPVIRYDFLNDHAEIKKLLYPPTRTSEMNLVQRGSLIITTFTELFSYESFDFQTTYAYNDFASGLPSLYKFWSVFYKSLAVVSVLFVLGRAIIKRKFEDVLLSFWIIIPLAFLTLYNTPEVVPRYFVFINPAVWLAMAVLIIELMRRVKWSKSVVWVLIFVAVFFNGYFVSYYYNFVLNYQSYRGVFGGSTDVVYSHALESLQFIIDDAKERGYEDFVITMNTGVKDKYSLEGNVRYIWKYVLHRGENEGSGLSYFLTRDNYFPGSSFTELKRIGPYKIFKID